MAATRPVRVERFSVLARDGVGDAPASFVVTARTSGGSGADIVLRHLGGEPVARIPIAVSTGPELDVAEPGDYTVSVEAQGKPLATRTLMVRALPCAGGTHALAAREVRGARILRSTHVDYAPFVLELPRWNARDVDPAYVVEWLRNGELAYEQRGREPLFDDVANLVETSSVAGVLATQCAFELGERYRLPSPARGGRGPEPGSWEVRIHREGQPSVSARFRVPRGGLVAQSDSGDDPDADFVTALELEPIETPAAAQQLLLRVPSACLEVCSGIINTLPGKPGTYTWNTHVRGASPQRCQERSPVAPHAVHRSDPYPLAFSAAELRAVMRSKEALARREALTAMFFGGPTAVDRPDFEYDERLSPDANWHRRRAWEASDVGADAAQKAERKARSMPLVPPLVAAIQKYGSAWSDAEWPAPPPVVAAE